MFSLAFLFLKKVNIFVISSGVNFLLPPSFIAYSGCDNPIAFAISCWVNLYRVLKSDNFIFNLSPPLHFVILWLYYTNALLLSQPQK